MDRVSKRTEIELKICKMNWNFAVLNWCSSLRNRSVDNKPLNQHIVLRIIKLDSRVAIALSTVGVKCDH